jgi:hypothetical protein
MAVKIYIVIFWVLTTFRLVGGYHIEDIPMKYWYPTTRLHGRIIQNTQILLSYAEIEVKLFEQNLHLSGIKAQFFSP